VGSVCRSRNLVGPGLKYSKDSGGIQRVTRAPGFVPKRPQNTASHDTGQRESRKEIDGTYLRTNTGASKQTVMALLSRVRRHFLPCAVVVAHFFYKIVRTYRYTIGGFGY
jgi:hypothetical protein